MHLSIRHKLIAFAFSIAFLVGGSIAVYSLYVGKRQILSSFEQEAFATSQLIARTISNEIYFMDIAAIRIRVESSRANSKIRSILVTDATGVLISDGTSENLAAGIKLEGNFVDQVLRAEQWKSTREGNIFRVGGPVLMPDGSYIGYLIAEFSFAPVDIAVGEAARSSLYITLIATVMGVIFAFFISRRFTRSIVSIVQAAEAIGRGKLKTRLQVSRSDELGDLAASVNRMAVALSDSYRNLESKISERTRDLESLHRAIAPISSSNNVDLLQNVVERVRDVTHADAALIRILDRNGEDYCYAAHTGFPVSYLEGTSRPKHGSALEQCVRSGEPLISPNIQEDSRFKEKRQAEAGFASCVFLPLRISGQGRGLVHLASRTPGYFHQEKETHLLAIAQQMSLAMENFELFQGVRQNLRRIQALREIDQAINSTLDLQQVLNILLEKIELFVPYAWATTVRLINDQTGVLEPVTCRNLDEAEWKAQPASHSNPGVVFTSGKPLAVEDLYADSSTNVEFFRKNGLASYLGVPLVVQGVTIGVLSLYTKTRRAFTEQEIEFLSTLAGQGSIAIQNSQLYEAAERRRREAEELARFAESLTENIDMGTMAARIVSSVGEFTHVRGTTLRLTEQDGSFRSIAAWGEIFSQTPAGKTVKPGIGLTSAAVAAGKPIWSADIATDTRFPLTPEMQKFHLASGNRSLLVLPLRAHENVIGTLVLVDRTGRTYSESEVALLQTFADQAALALDNARLFAAVRHSVEELQQKTADLEKANRAKDEFLSTMSHELRTPLNVVIGYAAMLKGEMLGHVNAEQQEALKKILARADDQLQMINAILQATRLGAGAVRVSEQAVNLNELLNELRCQYELPLGKDVSLTWQDFALPVLRTDGDKLKHILENLINNAIKFTEKGNIEIAARHDPLDRVVRFRVSDTGVGIAQELLPVVFDMFRQADSSDRREFEGVGLGLYIVKQLSELLGGSIEVTSDVGVGSTFTVTLPANIAGGEMKMELPLANGVCSDGMDSRL